MTGWSEKRREELILAALGESAFEDGDPADNYDRNAADKPGKEHTFQKVLAPKHHIEVHKRNTAIRAALRFCPEHLR